jgi:hypothetical protein
MSLSKEGLDLKIWGPDWEYHARRDAHLRSFVKGGPVWGHDYVKALGGACIGLGLLSKYCPDQFTTRSFEIPAAGTMLLAERTDEHSELFQEGTEAEFFSSYEELVDKLHFYSKNESARALIAKHGRQRALSCYRWKQVLSPAIEEIEKLRAQS